MLGEAKFKREEPVVFRTIIDGKEEKIEGVIYVVDAFGTSEQKEEPSYDIEAFYDDEIMLFKHIRESMVDKRES